MVLRICRYSTARRQQRRSATASCWALARAANRDTYMLDEEEYSRELAIFNPHSVANSVHSSTSEPSMSSYALISCDTCPVNTFRISCLKIANDSRTDERASCLQRSINELRGALRYSMEAPAPDMLSKSPTSLLAACCNFWPANRKDSKS